MSKIQQLSLHNFRNLKPAKLELSSGLNLFIGDNAAGKTALIESIWMLSTGRSFRTGKPQNCIQHEQNALTLFVELLQQQETHKLGLERSADAFKLRFNGDTIRSQTEFANKLPVQLLTPESHRLLEEGPKARRQFLDWGCFHYDDNFLPQWRHYQRSLKQRNHALKQHQPKAQIELWNHALVTTAEKISHIRKTYLEELSPYLTEFCLALMPELKNELSMQFRQGWNKQNHFEQALVNNLDKDLKSGHTQLGAHRADIRFKFGHYDAMQSLSRGQQKLFVCALLLAQASLYEKHCGEPVIMLIDDLPAELDEKHRTTLMSLLDLLGIQHLITSTDINLIPIMDPTNSKLFSIQQQSISPI